MGLALIAVVLAAAPKSIYQLSPVADGAVILTSSLAIGVPYLFGNGLLEPSCPCPRSSVSAIDRISLDFDEAWADDLSTVTAGLAVAVPAIVAGSFHGIDRVWLEDTTVEVEAVLVAGALVTASKYAIQRPIPLVVSGKEPGLIPRPDGYRSFFSGHTVVTVAALSAWAETWTLRHGRAAWPWLLTGAVSLSVMTERILAGHHYPSDVLVGAAVGLVVGTAVPALHLRKHRLALAVGPERGGAGLMLSAAF
jgi:membrane-associated phospholipid phosphatase